MTKNNNSVRLPQPTRLDEGFN